MKRILRNYFTFNKRERNGALVLLFIIVILFLYLALMPFSTEEAPADFATFDKEIAALTTDTATASLANVKKIASSTLPIALTISSPRLFDFNPNSLPEAEWKKLGLSDKQITTIKNYEAKGGKFRSKADVKKMYCISDKLYQQLEMHILIPAPETAQLAKKVIILPEVELNTADSTALVQLKGIGPAFAKRILNYRKRLGGFYTTEQLLEVYGIDSLKYEAIIHDNHITVEADKIERLPLNTASSADLKKHPYIKFNLANLIVNYRQTHGLYKSEEELKKLDLISTQLYDKLKNYITVN